ncbi:MAG: T9SS type A sorting domain-containing protein [Flavobacteriales bacterium]
MKKLKLSSLAFCGLLFGAQAQVLSPEVIASQGGNFQNAEMEVSYTVGEMAAITTISNNSFILTQGFHQPDKFVSVRIDEIATDMNIIAFPNPASSVLNVQINLDRRHAFKAECFDLSGRLVNEPIQINHASGEQTYQFNIAGLAPGVYFLRFSSPNFKQIQTINFTKHLTN